MLGGPHAGLDWPPAGGQCCLLSQSVNCSHFLGCPQGFGSRGKWAGRHVRLSGGGVAPGPTAPALAGLSQQWGDPSGFQFENGWSFPTRQVSGARRACGRDMVCPRVQPLPGCVWT